MTSLDHKPEREVVGTWTLAWVQANVVHRNIRNLRMMMKKSKAGELGMGMTGQVEGDVEEEVAAGGFPSYGGSPSGGVW